MKKLRIILFGACIALLLNTAVYGQDLTETGIEEQLQMLELDQVDREIQNIFRENAGYEQLDLSLDELSRQAVAGQLEMNMEGLLDFIANQLLRELYASAGMLRNVLIIALLAALLKNLDNAFSGSAIGETGFYVCYIALIVMLVISFNSAYAVAKNAIGAMIQFMQAMLPLMLALLISAGNYTVSFVFQPLAVGAVNVISVIIRDLILPFIVLGAMLQMINYVMPKEALQKMAELLSGLIQHALKGLMILFGALVSIQGVSAPLSDGMVNKGAKFAVGAIPVVGDALKGAVDSVFYWAGMVKSGVSIAAIIFTAAICAIPAIQLTVQLLIYKLTAAVIEPICDSRIVKCIDTAGRFVGLFILALISTAAMFLFLFMMVVLAGSK